MRDAGVHGPRGDGLQVRQHRLGHVGRGLHRLPPPLRGQVSILGREQVSHITTLCSCLSFRIILDTEQWQELFRVTTISKNLTLTWCLL